MSRPVICLTPVKNEEWILDSFLKCASLWADHIVVADQGSTDRTRDICRQFPKVTLVENADSDYSESSRQKLLLRSARSISKNAFLVAMDADEFLSANALESAEWKNAVAAEPGTSVHFPRVDLLRDTGTYFYHTVDDGDFSFDLGYIDDGSCHGGAVIHSTRVPRPEGGPVLQLHSTLVLHYQFLHPARVDSKHRWYMCFERLKFPEKPDSEIVKLYTWNKRTKWPNRPTKTEWFRGYRDQGIQVDDFADDAPFWWDWEVLQLFRKHGPRKFAGLDIWDVDWESIRQIGLVREIPDMPKNVIRQPKIPVSPLRSIARFARHLIRGRTK